MSWNSCIHKKFGFSVQLSKLIVIQADKLAYRLAKLVKFCIFNSQRVPQCNCHLIQVLSRSNSKNIKDFIPRKNWSSCRNRYIINCWGISTVIPHKRWVNFRKYFWIKNFNWSKKKDYAVPRRIQRSNFWGKLKNKHLKISVENFQEKLIMEF